MLIVKACDVICGLGHGICDVDTGELLSLNSGELVNAEIIASTKGKSGAPGELKGRFESGCLAKLISNDETGVYGYPATEVNCDDLDFLPLMICTLVERPSCGPHTSWKSSP